MKEHPSTRVIDTSRNPHRELADALRNAHATLTGTAELLPRLLPGDEALHPIADTLHWQIQQLAAEIAALESDTAQCAPPGWQDDALQA